MPKIRADEVRVGDTVSTGKVAITVGRRRELDDGFIELVEAAGRNLRPRGGVMAPSHRLELIRRG